ncbi:MAG: iron-containing alcohol dehydrogenase [Acidimicrobiia bacterium]
MATFELVLPGKIVFGVGASAELGTRAASLGSRALVVTGKEPLRQQPLIDGLEAAGVAVISFCVGHEPTVEDVKRGTDIARGPGCDLVVSIGGGSVLDTGKAIAALLSNPGDVMEYLEVIGDGKPLTTMPVPHVAVPTTAGTGSEATKNAVLLSEKHAVKVSMRSPFMVPTIALVDPDLTQSMPRSVTVSSGLDALTHLLESYVSLRANPLVDPFCEDGIRRAARSLQRAAADGDDLDSRLDMSLASLYGGIVLANAGLGAVHGFAGVLGGRLHVPHGLACGCLLAPVFDANISAAEAANAPVLPRFARVARWLTRDSDANPRAAVTWLFDLTESLGVPSLSDYGLIADMYEGICEGALRSSSMKGNPIPLDRAELARILARAA